MQNSATTTARLTLRSIRESRLALDGACPHCGCTRVIRWGWFADRRRYRCSRCRRTFSDLTGTAFAYRRRPELWRANAVCMVHSLSVRAIAARLGIHKDTAWRWRQRTLAHLAEIAPALRGALEVVVYRSVLCSERQSTPAPAAPPPGGALSQGAR